VLGSIGWLSGERAGERFLPKSVFPGLGGTLREVVGPPEGGSAAGGKSPGLEARGSLSRGRRARAEYSRGA